MIHLLFRKIKCVIVKSDKLYLHIVKHFLYDLYSTYAHNADEKENKDRRIRVKERK